VGIDRLSRPPKSLPKPPAHVSGMSKFSPEMADKIIEGLEKGYTRKMVAEGVGVFPKTVRSWMKSELPKHAGFLERVLEAEAKGRRSLVDLIVFHGEKDWRAAAWLLERTRAEFSLKAKTAQEARDELDRLSVERAQAELDHIKAKTDALGKNTLNPEQILELLDDARKVSQGSPSTEH